MTIREAINFNYAGIASEDMGVILASPESGLYNEHFLADRKIIETVIPNRNKRYFQRVVREPLSFPLSIFIIEWRDRDNLRQIQDWLDQEYYKPLMFDSQPGRIYYAMLEGASSITHNGSQDGYVTLNVKCNSPYSYSFPITHELTGNLEVVIFNEGDITVKPKANIIYHGADGNLTLTNASNGQNITFTNLQVDEEIFIDFENETILSSLEYLGVYRYDDHNDKWLELIVGDNLIEVLGDCSIKLTYELVYRS